MAPLYAGADGHASREGGAPLSATSHKALGRRGKAGRPGSASNGRAMFELDLPWWEPVLRATVVYLALLLMVRVTGKRTVGQFTPFDLVVVMLLSESVSNAISGGDNSLSAGLLAASTLIVLDVLLALATARSRRVQDAVQGRAVIVGRDGQLFEDVLRRERVPRSDVERALRAADCTLPRMRLAILESDGNISILKRD
jgi:uncharacterized membrane protein YcaP (DUF421 family)